jgi:hypothetical protein
MAAREDDISVLVRHLEGMYNKQERMYEFALFISYSNQSTFGLMSNAVLMLSSIYAAGCAGDKIVENHDPLFRPFNLLLKLKNEHFSIEHDSLQCSYELRRRGNRYKDLETEYNRLKKSIDSTDQITTKLRPYIIARKRLEFYIELSRWHIINKYQNKSISPFFNVNNGIITVITVNSNINEINEGLILWENAMKTWATELLYYHGLEKTIDLWKSDHSYSIAAIVTYLQEQNNSRVTETVIGPGSSQFMCPQNENGSNDNNNNNSDDESKHKNKRKIAEDDDNANNLKQPKVKRHSKRLEKQNSKSLETVIKIKDDKVGDLNIQKDKRRQSKRLDKKRNIEEDKGTDEEDDDMEEEEEDDDDDSEKNDTSKTKKPITNIGTDEEDDEEEDDDDSEKNDTSKTKGTDVEKDVACNKDKVVDTEVEGKGKQMDDKEAIKELIKLSNTGLDVVGFPKFACQKLLGLVQELTNTLKTLSRKNTVTNSTLMSHMKLVDGFDVRLKKYLEGNQWTTSIKDASVAVLAQSSEPEKKLNIKLITLEETSGSKRKLGNVMLVNGPIFDSKMLDELVDTINRSPMCKSTDVLGGSKKDTYLGYFSQRNPTQYGYRDGTIGIKAMPIKGAMVPLLDIIQNHILKNLYDHMGVGKKTIATCIGTDIFEVKQNSLQINLSKGGGGFGEHKDSTSTTCMIGTEIGNQTDEYFPFESEMVVVTFFICLDKNQKLVNNSKCRSKLTFRSVNTKEIVGDIITESMGFHIQFSNVQHTCLHAVDKLGQQEEGMTRIALSSRYTLKQQYDGKTYPYYIRCLDHVNGKLADAIRLEDPTIIPTDAMEVENITSNTKDKGIEEALIMDSLKLDAVGMTKLIRNPVALGVPRNNAVNSLRSRSVFNTLMKAKKTLSVVRTNRALNNTTTRYYEKLKKIGTIMEADKVREMLKLSKGGQSSIVGTYHNDLNQMHGIVLEHEYKNMTMNAIPYFKLVHRYKDDKKRLFKEINKQKAENVRYTVGPSGGNYSNGSAFMTQTSKVDNTVCETAHTGQISHSMIAACLNRIVIGDVWVPVEWATGIKNKKKRGSKMINVGPARGYSCTGQTHNDDQPQHLLSHGMNGSWTTVGNMVYVLEQVYHKYNFVTCGYSGYVEEEYSDFVFEGERIGVGIDRYNKVPVTPADFEHRHPENVANEWLTNELEETDKFSVKIQNNNNGKNDLVTIKELIAQMARISLASFARMKDYSVNPDGVSYLPLLEVGMVNGIYPIPNVSRCYHIPTMIIITALGMEEKSTGRFVRRSISSIKTLDEMVYIMMATLVVRTTGGTLLFQLFHQYLQNADSIICHEFELPSTRGKWVHFKRFMLEKIMRGAHGMERYVTVLYDRSLCDAAYGTVQEYVSFLEAMRDDLHSFMKKGWKKGFNYSELVPKLSNFIGKNGYNQRKIGTKERKDCNFVGHQIACDMNELFHDIILYDCEKDKISFGSYGQKGLEMIVGKTTLKTANKELIALTQKILGVLKQNKHVYLLDMLGLYMKEGIVVSKINDAPVWEADVESWLCKLVITNQKTGGAFCGSSKLWLNNRRYEFPLGNAPLRFEPFYKIAEEALYGLFSNRIAFGKLPVSSHFRYVSTDVWDEDISWKQSCKDGLARQITLLKFTKTFRKKTVKGNKRKNKNK